jgi:PleD family two-component response regulator
MPILNETSLKKTVLIIDDSRTVRASLAKILDPKFSTIEAEDGEEGWEKLQSDSSIKLVITDIMMPKLDGYGLTCRIRGADTDRLQKIPIIVVTSAEDKLSRERAHACGANNFIVKPVNPEDLLERVNFHTEVHLNGEPTTAPQMQQYESEIDTAVIETPDVEKALEILQTGQTGSLTPYAADIALKVIPLLEYCNKTFDMAADEHIKALKEKLQSV